MRQIKFRAWDTLGEEMFTVMGYDLVEDEVWSYHDGYSFEDIELMQYTGLKDKNGVEIYEYNELDGAYEVIFKDLKYSLRHISNNDIIGLQDYWRDKNGEIEVTREYTKV